LSGAVQSSGAVLTSDDLELAAKLFGAPLGACTRSGALHELDAIDEIGAVQIVSRANETTVADRRCSAACVWLNVVKLKESSFGATIAVVVDECALALVSLPHRETHGSRHVTRELLCQSSIPNRPPIADPSSLQASMLRRSSSF
jgi:hypothetical protein